MKKKNILPSEFQGKKTLEKNHCRAEAIVMLLMKNKKKIIQIHIRIVQIAFRASLKSKTKEKHTLSFAYP